MNQDDERDLSGESLDRRVDAPPLARVLPMRKPGKRGSHAGPTAGWARYAAAALALVGLGIALRWNATPRTPSPPASAPADATRGSELTLEAPVGELRGGPRTFSWRPASGASSYRLEVRDVAGELLFSFESRETSLAAPAELAAILESRVSYSWLIVARDAAGAEFARSAPAIFRFEKE